MYTQDPVQEAKRMLAVDIDVDAKSLGNKLMDEDSYKDQGLYVPHADAYLVPLGGTPTQAQVLIPVVKKAKKLKPKRKGAFGLPEKPSDTTNPSATLNKDNPNRRDQT